MKEYKGDGEVGEENSGIGGEEEVGGRVEEWVKGQGDKGGGQK